MPDEKVCELLRKIKALADSGVDGEKRTASEMLHSLMQKHGISLEDIETDIRKERHIKVKATQSKFLLQVVSSILGQGHSYKRSKRNKTDYWFDLTESEFIEVEWKMDFYWKKYQEDLKVFYSAFIQRNHLYAKKLGDNKSPDPTPEEEQINKVLSMMSGMQSHTPIKRIEAAK